MTSKEYRKNLKNLLTRTRIHQSILSINNKDLLNKLLIDLDNPNFSETASIKQLYDLRGRLFQLLAFSKGLFEAIENSGLNFLGEFEDKKMSLADVGITNKNFICIKDFTDPLSKLNIKIGTEIEVEELSYANVSNMITAYYTNLITDRTQIKILEVFENGKQATLLNLKILEINFNPK